MVQLRALVETIIVLTVLIAGVALLMRRGVVSSEHSPLFSRLVTEFALPAYVFVTLARPHDLPANHLHCAALMFLSITAVGAMAWAIDRVMGPWRVRSSGLSSWWRASAARRPSVTASSARFFPPIRSQ